MSADLLACDAANVADDSGVADAALADKTSADISNMVFIYFSSARLLLY
jgi:hypothetical protein